MAAVRQRVLGVALCALLLSPAVSLAARKFFPDDPLAREPRPLPAGHPRAVDINEYFDYFQNTFFEPVKERKKLGLGGPSQAVNTLGEAPDSAWFTNRMGSVPMSPEELARGPGDARPPAADRPWTVISGKAEGVTPGVVIRDSKQRVYYLKFDPKSNPEMASAADMIGSKFFYALGYNTPENYIVRFTRSQLTVGKEATYRDLRGLDRGMTEQDIDDLLRKAPREPDGRYRALASLVIGGDILGPFRYYGTRSDDPNDITPHEDRRDLRGLFVFAAWLNHTDAKSLNTLDSVVEEGGVRFVKHYLIDFGAILGSDSFEAKSPRAGNVYLFDFKPAAWQFLSLGLYVPSWMRVDFPKLPAAGHLQYEMFDPRKWKSNYPNPAFDLKTPADAYWAARKVMAFSDDAIRRIVATGQIGDKRAEDWIVKCLIERRDRIGRAYLEGALALDNFRIAKGRLLFEDLSVKYGLEGRRSYSASWYEFDNESETRRAIAGASGFEVPRSAAEYLAAEIRGPNPRQSVTVFVHGNRVVGIDRAW